MGTQGRGAFDPPPIEQPNTPSPELPPISLSGGSVAVACGHLKEMA
eukprot:CAMPEP_0174362860 /NCGR_PEP_ID=MMETSP0811_2-20130205/66544_1 /TAXON_ID=73025 ORGANISM="Eutreptiella gymnastica-like, Strain CCMP1594" /NCGR_SAMPLE_ID=MMETSP0811_2 /ASSEMBLY_ACC=CAM_ASM_000667 /LENGTH=45 /DNA_ID= /DNA_START= /DNA_END= /DNA_ORIENTATION=